VVGPAILLPGRAAHGAAGVRGPRHPALGTTRIDQQPGREFEAATGLVLDADAEGQFSSNRPQGHMGGSR
jgi:hypothetical protein